MDFKQAITTCFRKYADFTGRASRPEYWWFALFSVLVSLVVSGLLGDWMGMLVNLGLLLPSLAAGTRRLHDMGKSGWFQLVWLVPFIGWAVMIYWLVQATAGPNEYGTGPDAASVPQVPPGVPPAA
jgi:uncharacterized membrane protein YhaH (DUF805 family)